MHTKINHTNTHTQPMHTKINHTNTHTIPNAHKNKSYKYPHTTNAHKNKPYKYPHNTQCTQKNHNKNTDFRVLLNKERRSGKAPHPKLTAHQQQVMQQLVEAHGNDVEVRVCIVVDAHDVEVCICVVVG